MSDRRNRPPNRWGCKPTEDVCVEHDRPLVCRHGCDDAADHRCNELDAPCGKCKHPLRDHSAETYGCVYKGCACNSWAAVPEEKTKP